MFVTAHRFGLPHAQSPIFRRLQGLTLALAFTGAAAAAGPAQAASKVSQFVLDNGMEVVVVPDHRVPVVTQQVWYKVGAADDPGVRRAWRTSSST